MQIITEFFCLFWRQIMLIFLKGHFFIIYLCFLNFAPLTITYTIYLLS